MLKKLSIWYNTLSIKIKLAGVLSIPLIIVVYMGIIQIVHWYFILILIPIEIFWYIASYFLFLKRLSIIGARLFNTFKGEADLTHRLPVINKDEIGSFSRNFNILIAQLHDIIFELKNVTGQSEQIGNNLAASTREISTSIEKMSSQMTFINNNSQTLDGNFISTKKAIEEIETSIQKVVNNINIQSASVEQSSATIEELISSINNITAVTSNKIKTVDELMKLVRSGEENMEATVESIQNISNSADVINELILVINNVADQINILAMNAAIEAAHAGEYGKGFGVVADEIRRLAEATTNNASNISNNLNRIIININDTATLT